MSTVAKRNRVRPGEAWSAIRALMKDPDDTTQVFRIIRAVNGNSQERTFQRFRASEHGRRILAEQRSLRAILSDREALLAMPVGSLGHAYAEFTAREKISPDGLVEASEAAGRGADEPVEADRLLFGTRLRDSHDLWHVVTGYGRDLFGEAALLAFTFRQTRNRGIGLILLFAYLRAGRGGERGGQRALIRDGYRRAGSAGWLPGADWEALLPEPLSAVREALGAEPIESYTGLRSGGAPALA